MKLSRLQELRRKLDNEKELSRIWTFYMDHFADHEEFTDVGEQVQNSFLTDIVHQICQQMFGRPMSVTGLLFIYIQEYQFVHAPFQVEGRPGGLIYFEEAKKGMLAVSADFPPSDLVKYSRFSAILKL